jgi:hypothetical protein
MVSPGEPVSSLPDVQPPTAGPRRTHRLPAGLLALATSILAILLAIVLGARWRQPAYVMPFAIVVVGGLCAVLTWFGGAMAALRGQVTPWLAPLLTLVFFYCFLVVGILVIFLAALVLLIVVNRRSHRVQVASTRSSRVGPPLLLTLGLVPLSLLVLLGGPVVECMPQGVESSTPIWSWSESLSATGESGEIGDGSGSSSDLSRTSGSVTEGATTYTYVCLGSKLLHFDAH